MPAEPLSELPTFDPGAAYGGPEGAYRYLVRAIANAAGKLNRGDRRRRNGLPPAAVIEDEVHPLDRATDDEPGPLERVLRAEELAEGRAILAELPQDQRAVMVARAAGFAPNEIQSQLGLTSRQYRKRIEKANRLLFAA